MVDAMLGARCSRGLPTVVARLRNANHFYADDSKQQTAIFQREPLAKPCRPQKPNFARIRRGFCTFHPLD